MCDIRAGQLILCFPKVDPAGQAVVKLIREEHIEHVSYVESIGEKLNKLELAVNPELDFELHLVEVPGGQETWKIHYLQFYYKHELFKVLPEAAGDTAFLDTLTRSNYQFTVAPNYVLTCVSPVVSSAPISAQGAQFGSEHAFYKQLVGLPGAGGIQDEVRVLLPDTGIASDAKAANLVIDQEVNFLDPLFPHTARMNMATAQRSHC
jgi:hypothetical protein